MPQWIGSFDYGLRLYLCNLVASAPGFALRRRVLQKLARWQIGPNSSIHRGTRLFCLGGLQIGCGSVVNGECWLDGRRGITIGDHVSLSIGCKILTLSHDPQSPAFEPVGAPVCIHDHAWIGAFATILPGVTIGQGAVVGAGSIVTKDVAPYAIVAGSPAKVMGQRTRDLQYKLNHQPWFF